jgi:K+-sensing histidine kinase KdpD
MGAPSATAARLSSLAQAVIAAGLTAMATAIGVALDRTMSVAGIAMVYLLAIVPAALLLERFAGLLTSILSVSALNFFFVPPRYTFEVDGAEYWWTLAILLALSLALSSLIARLRDRQQRAETATRQSLQLHALTQALATTASPGAEPTLCHLSPVLRGLPGPLHTPAGRSVRGVRGPLVDRARARTGPGKSRLAESAPVVRSVRRP